MKLLSLLRTILRNLQIKNKKDDWVRIAYPLLDENKWIMNLKDSFKTKDGWYGNSICCICGKKMPRVWDAVCKHCKGTFCRDHVVVIYDPYFPRCGRADCFSHQIGHYYCLDDVPEPDSYV